MAHFPRPIASSVMRGDIYMSGKRIILLSDGTGNSASKVWKSNVWRVFESLDLRGNDQVAFYDDGVGTSSFKPLAILGEVTAGCMILVTVWPDITGTGLARSKISIT
jgi:Uncharacterized alpha/beta hydrolase domain (DUF2235)